MRWSRFEIRMGLICLVSCACSPKIKHSDAAMGYSNREVDPRSTECRSGGSFEVVEIQHCGDVVDCTDVRCPRVVLGGRLLISPQVVRAVISAQAESANATDRRFLAG